MQRVGEHLVNIAKKKSRPHRNIGHLAPTGGMQKFTIHSIKSRNSYI